TGAINGSTEANGWPVGMLLKKDYPEVEAVIYTRGASNLPIIHEGKRFEERIFYASEDFLKVFTFPLSEGNPSTALLQPNSLVITESMEKKYFGQERALGKSLTLADTMVMVITGVMRDVPSRSHMQFDMLVSFSTYARRGFTYDDGWGNINVRN